MATTLNTAWKNDLLSALLTTSLNSYWFDNVDVRTTPTPATVDSAVTGTRLVYFPTIYSSGLWSTPKNGSTYTTIYDGFDPYYSSIVADASGTALWARLYTNQPLVAWADANVIGEDAGGFDATTIPAGIIILGGGATTIQTVSSAQVKLKKLIVHVPEVVGTLTINTALRDRICTALTCRSALPIGAFASATINFYTGTAPATANLPATGTLIASLTGATWASPSSGSAALSGTPTATGLAAGTATYCRVVKGDFVVQGSVGVGTGDFQVVTTAVTLGSTLTLNSATVAL